MSKFDFTPIIPRCYTRSSEPNLIIGKGVCSLTGAFFSKYGTKFSKVSVYFDEGPKVIGLHFHSAVNKHPNTFRLRPVAKSDRRCFSSKTLREKVHLFDGEAIFVAPVEPAPQEGPDFFIVRLKPQEEEK